MSRLHDFRPVGDTSFFNLKWRTKINGVKGFQNLGDFDSIDLVLERQGFPLDTLPGVIDNALLGEAHFEPTEAMITLGQHFYRIIAVVTATGEIRKFPKKGPVQFDVGAELAGS